MVFEVQCKLPRVGSWLVQSAELRSTAGFRGDPGRVRGPVLHGDHANPGLSMVLIGEAARDGLTWCGLANVLRVIALL
jgi:hypothetical protein